MNGNLGNGRPKLCYYFQRGDCRYGNRCWDVHSIDENQNSLSQKMAKLNMGAAGNGPSFQRKVKPTRVKEPPTINTLTKGYYIKHHDHFSNHTFNMMNRIEEEFEIKKKYMNCDRIKYMQEMIRIGSLKRIRTQFSSAMDAYEYDMDYSSYGDDKIMCSNKWIKPEPCKPWTLKDLPKIVIVELLEESKSYCTQPSRLKSILKRCDIIEGLKENPRFNLEKNCIALKIDDAEKIQKMLKKKFLINEKDAERYRRRAKGQISTLFADYESEDEFFVWHAVFPVRCFQLDKNSSECERWWEDSNKHVVVHIIPSGDRKAYDKKIEIKFQNDQEVEETELLSIAEWSRHLKPKHQYFCGLCNKCAAEPSKQEDSSCKKLLVCAGCQIVSYCSKDCQKEDWNDHKKVCKEIGVNRSFLGKKFSPGMNVFEVGHDLIKSMDQECAKKLFLSYLRFRGHPLEWTGAIKYGEGQHGSIAVDQYCNGMYQEPTRKIRHNELKFPKICYECFEGKREELTVCDCRCVAFCGKDHKGDKHKNICRDLYRTARVYSYCKNNIVSELPMPQTQAEVSNLMAVFKDPAQYPVPAEYVDDPWLDAKQALVSEHLSVPLTILYSMKEIFQWTNQDFIGSNESRGTLSLTIHLVSAQPLLDPVSWELFLHECNEVKQLNLVFCNNGVSHEEGRGYNPSADINDCVNHLNTSKKLKRCEQCQENNRLITYHVFNGSYSSYFRQVDSIKPDIVFASGTSSLIRSVNSEDDEDKSDAESVDEDKSDDDDESDEFDFDDDESVEDDDESDSDEESWYRETPSALLKIKRCPLILAEDSARKMERTVDNLCRSYRCQELMDARRNPFAGFSRERKVIDKIGNQSAIRNEKKWITCIRRKN